MMQMLGGLALLALFGWAIAWRIVQGRRAKDAPRDDTRRAGEHADPTSTEATHRALGRTAWTRISGP
ncbi:hypothetical protein GCM10027064_01120 [Microbacterium petrolearium]|jgi:hypothetical protein